MVVHEECAFRPLETLDFPSPSTRRTPRRVLSCVSPTTDAPITRLESSGKRGCIALPSIAFPSSSSRIIDVVQTRRFDNRCKARRNDYFPPNDIFRLDRCTLRFNLTLNSGKDLHKICPRRDQVRRRDLVKGDFAIISLSLDSAAENWSRVSYGSYITDAASLVPSGCRVFLMPFSSSLRARQILRARKGVASSLKKTAQICSVHCPFASSFLRTRELNRNSLVIRLHVSISIDFL